MRIRTALNAVFEATITAILFSVSWSTYESAAKQDGSRPETNAMIAGTFIAGSIALLMLTQSVLKFRQPPSVNNK